VGRIVNPPGQPKIGQDRLAFRIQQDVARLQIAMHDALLVGLVEGQGQLADQFGDLPRVGQQTFADHFRQRPPLDIGHRDVMHAGDLVDVVDGADIGAAEHGCGPRFSIETLHQFAGVAAEETRGLQRDPAVELFVVSQEHGTDSALPQQPFDAIPPKHLADRQG
jgi:hypothetical protein